MHEEPSNRGRDQGSGTSLGLSATPISRALLRFTKTLIVKALSDLVEHNGCAHCIRRGCTATCWTEAEHDAAQFPKA